MSKITVETKHFGEKNILENQVLTFPNGILAFEEYKKFVILEEHTHAMFHWLQSLDDSKLAFLIMNPHHLKPDYIPDIMAYEVENLFGSRSLEGLSLWCIITIPPNHPESMTINFQGPLIVSQEKRLGGQFISNNDSHQVRTPVLELVEAGEIA
jgi:flagellar assembly factor FliW